MAANIVDRGALISRAGGEVVDYDIPVNPDLDEIETHDEAERAGPDEAWRHWQDEVRASIVAERRWREEGRQAEIDYFGDNEKAYTSAEYQKDEHKTNIIHANIEVLKPLVFSSPPTPIVRRRFGGDGANDPTDRIAAMVAQRMSEYLIETSGFEEAVSAARDDWLVPGRGVIRVRYKAEFQEVQVPSERISADGTVEIAVETVEEKTGESVKVVHWPWPRVFFSAVNSWDETRWIGWETPMTKKRVVERFGEDIADATDYPINGLKGRSTSDPESDMDGWEPGADEETSQTPSVTAHDQCIVYEIWDRESGKIIWWSPHYRESIMDEIEAPVQIEGFFDCPKPLLAVTKGGHLTPRPDTAYYRARADEIDRATRKLSMILNAISVSGLYPGKNHAEIEKLMKGDKNRLVPIEEWISFMERGGAEGMISWLPLAPMVAAAQALVQMREQAKMQLYEISGISDILRGQSNPNETLGAQQIKGNYANIRLRDKQRKVQLFSRDAIRIMLEICFEHFDTKTIYDIVNLPSVPMTEDDLMQANATVDYIRQRYAQVVAAAQAAQQEPPPEPEIPFFEQTSFERVHEVLRNDLKRKFRLSIETDGTILADPEEDKRQRVEFIMAFTNMAQTLVPLAMSGTVKMSMIKELLLFAVKGFPKSQTLEGMIAGLPDDAQQPEPQKDPRIAVAEIKAQVDAMISDRKIEADQQSQQSEQAHELRMKGLEMLADGLRDDASRNAAQEGAAQTVQGAEGGR